MSGKENNVSEPSGQETLTKVSTQEDAEKPKHTPSIIDQLSRTKTKEEIMSKKRAKEQGLDKVKSTESAAQAEPEPPRGRDQSQSVTTSTADPAKPRHPDDSRPSMALAPKSTRIQERSVSPGTLPDGSHEQCSGERGESYIPPSGLGKLTGKIRGIGH